MIYSVSAVILCYSLILQNTFLENVVLTVFLVGIILIVILLLLFPYILYIPGDNSYIENILKRSKKPQAKILIDYKKKFFDKGV